MPTGEDADNGPRQIGKVERVIQDYGLTGMEEELVTSWTGEDGERHSLRDLAEFVNHAILRTAMAEARMNPLEGEVENTYRLLTDDEVSSGIRTEAETSLERNGIDVDRLTQNFVSHQAVHTYLTKHRGIDSPTDAEDRDQVEKTADTVQRLQSRLAAVAKNGLQSLRNTGRISLGDFSVLVNVRVFCEDCGTQSDFPELLRTGGCECEK